MNKNTIKPEMTAEAKARFFALYWGEVVIQDVDNAVVVQLYPVHPSNMYRFEESNLLLKPLSSITDEDAIEVGILTGCWSRKEAIECGDEIKEQLIGFGKNFCKSIGKDYGIGLGAPFASGIQDISDAFDFLRSKSYALPFMGWSVEQMVEAGWIKLKQKGGGV